MSRGVICAPSADRNLGDGVEGNGKFVAPNKNLGKGGEITTPLFKADNVAAAT